MKAIVVAEPGHLALADIAAPEIGPYDALVNIEVCGLCNSTDAKLIQGTMYWAPPMPFVLGHESVGTVVSVGPKVRHVRVGDRVTRPLAFWPGSRMNLNVAMGGFAELGIVRDGRAMVADGDLSLLDDYNATRQLVVPPHLTAVEAALAISLSETASVLAHLPNLRNVSVAIAGTGVAGLAFTLWCKLAGARVIVLGRRASRLEIARQLGADVTINTSDPEWPDQVRCTCPGGIDGALEATGDVALADQLVPLVRSGGFTVAYGVAPTGSRYHDRWQPAIVEEHRCFAWVADLIRRRWIRPEWFVTHQWSLADAIDTIQQVERLDVLKGFVVMNPGER